MNKKLLYAVISILVLMIISNVILISMIIDYKNSIPVMIDNSTKNAVKELKVYDKIDNLIELKVSSIKLVDGKDGKDGVSIKGSTGEKGERGESIKGDTGLSAYQIAVNNGFIGTEQEWQESIKGSDGNDGLTPIIRCNVTKNRWEHRYSEYDIWGTTLDENNNPVPCTINQ